MVELSKVIRLYTNLVMVASATVAAFLISPSSGVQHYRNAQVELERLRDVLSHTGEYQSHVENELNRQQFFLLQKAMNPAEVIPEVRSAGAAPTPPVENAPKPATLDESPLAIPASSPTQSVRKNDEIEITEFLKDGLRITLRLATTQTVEYATIDPECFRGWGKRIPFKCDFPQRFVTVSDAYRYLVRHDSNALRPESLQVFEPDIADFAKRFRTILAERPSATLTAWRIVTATSSENGTSESTGAATSPCTASGCLPTVARLEMEFTEAGATKKLCTSIYGSWSCASCNSIQITPYMAWLSVQSDTKAMLLLLVDNKDQNRKAWLPLSHHVWSEIGAKEIEEAITTVALRIANQTERISLFGLSASIASASIAFPVAVAGVLWLSCIHLTFLLSCLQKKNCEIDGVCEQWFGFMPNLPAQITSHILTSLVPVAVFAWLLSLSSPWPYRELVGVVLGVVLLASSIMHWWKLREVQRAIRPHITESNLQTIPSKELLD